MSAQIAPRKLPIYTPVIHPKLKKLVGDVLDISQGPALDMAEKLHRFGTGQVSEQLMGQALDDETVGMIAENETNICQYALQYYSYKILMSSNLVRQRTIGSPLRDYIPALRIVDAARYMAGKIFRIKEWAVDEKMEKAREYRSMQQLYIHKMVGDLKDRIAAGDETPSILGNILRQKLLTEEMVLLASYTGSMFSLFVHFMLCL